MKRAIAGLALSLGLLLSLASPALAETGADYGKHHADHAIAETGFTADMNPGTMHQGFSGWTGQ